MALTTEYGTPSDDHTFGGSTSTNTNTANAAATATNKATTKVSHANNNSKAITKQNTSSSGSGKGGLSVSELQEIDSIMSEDTDIQKQIILLKNRQLGITNSASANGTKVDINQTVSSDTKVNTLALAETKNEPINAVTEEIKALQAQLDSERLKHTDINAEHPLAAAAVNISNESTHEDEVDTEVMMMSDVNVSSPHLSFASTSSPTVAAVTGGAGGPYTSTKDPFSSQQQQQQQSSTKLAKESKDSSQPSDDTYLEKLKKQLKSIQNQRMTNLANRLSNTSVTQDIYLKKDEKMAKKVESELARVRAISNKTPDQLVSSILVVHNSHTSKAMKKR